MSGNQAALLKQKPNIGINRLYRLMMLTFTSLIIIVLIYTHAPTQPRFEPLDIYRIRIDDPELIALITQTQMIIEDSLITSLDVLDLTLNGFGENDLVITNPMRNPYILTLIPDTLKIIMRNWESVELKNLVQDANITSEEVAEADYGSEHKFAQTILISVLRVLEKFYHANSVRFSFFRDEQVTSISMWDYKKDSLSFQLTDGFSFSDTVQSFDILYLSNTDTIFFNDTLYYDLLYIYQTVQESVFVPPKLPPRSQRKR